jgi:D-serine dehydratase
MDLDKAAKRLERQLAKGAHAKAHITFLWLRNNHGGGGRMALRLHRILREAKSSLFLEYLQALCLVLGFLQTRKFKEGMPEAE